MSSKVVGVGVWCLCVLTGCYEFHLRDGAAGDGTAGGGGVAGFAGVAGAAGSAGAGGAASVGADAGAGGESCVVARVPQDYGTLADALNQSQCAQIIVSEPQAVSTLRVRRDVTITTPSDDIEVPIIGDGSGSVVALAEGTVVVLERLRISGGGNASGAGIVSNAQLTLRDVTVSDNSAVLDGPLAMGGGLLQFGASVHFSGHVVFERNTARSDAAGASASGGAIALSDTAVTMEGSLALRDNRVVAHGAGMGGAVALVQSSFVGRNVTFEGNSITLIGDVSPLPLPFAGGGAVSVMSGSFDVSDVAFVDNRVAIEGEAAVGGHAEGAGVFCERGATVHLRRGSATGGLVSVNSFSESALAIAHGGFASGACALTIEGMNLSDNHAIAIAGNDGASRAMGGALRCARAVWSVHNTLIRDNTVGAHFGTDGFDPGSSIAFFTALAFGGGIASEDCDLDVADSLLRENHAVLGADGERGERDRAGGGGLAILSGVEGDEHGDKHVRIERTGIVGNRVQAEAQGGAVTAQGGGVFLHDRSPIPPSLVMVNVTLSGNLAHAQSSARRSRAAGGGLAVDATSMQPVSVRLSNVTIAHNDVLADAAAGGGISAFQTTQHVSIQLNDSIVWGNTRRGGTVADDCDGAALRGVHNLVSELACFASVESTNRNMDPQLGAITTPTGHCVAHPIASSSPARDSGSPGGCLASHPGGTRETTEDQCGRARGGACDIGATEATP